jgi:hypothetical protein
MEDRPSDDREERERRAEELRRRVEELVGSEPGERTPPRSPHEFVEEQMREEAERLERERADAEGSEDERGDEEN